MASRKAPVSRAWRGVVFKSLPNIERIKSVAPPIARGVPASSRMLLIRPARTCLAEPERRSQSLHLPRRPARRVGDDRDIAAGFEHRVLDLLHPLKPMHTAGRFEHLVGGQAREL